ncbi:MAG: BatD family protein [Sandaracinaceae bacterium]|nr:BatD family protein [Sandaracinaceae bacterium]
MRWAWKKRWLAFLASVWAMPLYAQEGLCRLSVHPHTVRVGDQLQIDVFCQAEGAQISPPEIELEGFTVLRRQLSQPFQLSFGFGHQQRFIQSSSRLTLVVRANQAGEFKIGPAVAYLGSQRILSDEVMVRVLGNPTAPPPSSFPPSSTPTPAPPTGALDGAVYDNQAFLRVVVDRKEAFVGQQITVTYYLYVRSMTNQPEITEQPSTDGFWIHDLLDRNQPPDSFVQQVGGLNFRVYPLRRFAAFPLRPGKLTFGSMTMQIPVGDPFDVLFGRAPAVLERRSVPIEVNVRPLPPGAPQGLPVHVGTLEAQAQLDRQEASVGDAVVLELRLKGLGQVEGIPPPSILVPGLRLLKPEGFFRSTVQGERVGGERHFRWLIIPEQPGSYAIGPFRWAVFDPEKAEYHLVESPPLVLKVTGQALPASQGESTPEKKPEGAGPASENENPAQQLGPIRTRSAFARRATPIAKRSFYPLALAGAPLLFGIALVGRSIAWRRKASLGSERSLKALRHALSKIQTDDPREAYRQILLVLRTALETKLKEGIGSLTHGELEQFLQECGMDSKMARQWRETFESIEMARFAKAGGESAEIKRYIGQAEALIKALDSFSPHKKP